MNFDEGTLKPNLINQSMFLIKLIVCKTQRGAAKSKKRRACQQKGSVEREGVNVEKKYRDIEFMRAPSFASSIVTE